MDRIDDYLMLHMTDFMSPRSFANLAMTSQRFREPMIQTQLKYRIETSVFVEIQGIVRRPVSEFRDETHTHLQFVFDTIVFEKHIKIYTFARIFKWHSITSSSYIWDFEESNNEVIHTIHDTFAKLTLYMSYDAILDEYIIHHLRFTYRTHITRDDTSWYIFVVLLLIVICCDPIVLLLVISFNIITMSLSSHPVISMIAAT
jgi:hypothetical protein